MDRKVKLAATFMLVGFTATACAPNPYWQYPGARNYNRTTVYRPVATTGAVQQGGVTHNHCGRVHTHALPPQGLAHHHGDGCMAGAVSNTASTSTASTYSYTTNTQPRNNNYGYNTNYNNNGYSNNNNNGSYGNSNNSNYVDYSGYNSYNTPKGSTNNNNSSSYYYEYGGNNNTGSSGNYGSSYNSGSSSYGSSSYGTGSSSSSYSGSKGSSSSSTSSSSSSSSSYSGGSYTVQRGDTVFQVMRNTGVYWKDIIRLNSLQAPDYALKPGQQLRLK